MESQLSLEKKIIPLAIFVQFLHSIEIQQISAGKFEIWSEDKCQFLKWIQEEGHIKKILFTKIPIQGMQLCIETNL